MAQKISRTRSTWKNMIRRCTNPQDRGWRLYGGRGITVCDRWKKFSRFLEDMGEKPEGQTLDRIDNNAGYSPDNCRWTTAKVNGRNKRTNKMLSYNGETLTASEWAERLGVRPTVIYGRIKAGHPIDVVLGPRMRVDCYFFCFNGTTDSVKGWAKRTGISGRTIRRRISNGWDISKILTTPVFRPNDPRPYRRKQA